MKRTHLTTLAATSALLAAIPLPSHAQDDGEWEWMVAPYLWAASVGTDLTTRFPVSTGGTRFPDLIDDIDGAFQAHLEVQNDSFGMFADFTYIGLGDNKDFERLSTDSQLDSYLFEAAAVWSPGEGRLKGIELFGGLRYIDVDLSVAFQPHDVQLGPLVLNPNDSYSDLMLGARYTWAFAERWRLTLRGDGSFGDTDGTWNASIVGQYHVKYGQWLLGYRYLSVEVEDERRKIDLTMSGPMVGFGFVF
ncbi:hypothetical protein MNR01_01800 [Lysobacter sp. S4-A87]|uniref:hypothetical protein n=1 Tax=Lysobacter sp. S4-A87 TaxID=2925843 RepID=UPI001F53D5F7|nr:hypothetical protein [Lysobacter sp. S4-A87]UNK49796.1 hypothetical protein MNR01_01800 [Lysobacter sp. S4-A87]